MISPKANIGIPAPMPFVAGRLLRDGWKLLRV
jgi:hypothetical protein